MKVRNFRVIGHQAAGSDLNLIWVNRRQFEACGEFTDLNAVNNEYAFGRCEEPIDVFSHSSIDIID